MTVPYSRGLVLVVLVALALLVSRLMLAPIHGVHDAAACSRAYDEARTHLDTVSADFLSYPDPAEPGVDHRCGAVRTGVVGRAHP
jgi:hypothetical protein